MTKTSLENICICPSIHIKFSKSSKLHIISSPHNPSNGLKTLELESESHEKKITAKNKYLEILLFFIHKYKDYA